MDIQNSDRWFFNKLMDLHSAFVLFHATQKWAYIIFIQVNALPLYLTTVKRPKFDILFGENIFFLQNLFKWPPSIFLEVCQKFRSMERWSENFDFHIARSPKNHFSAGVELRSSVPNFVMWKNSMMQMCSG